MLDFATIGDIGAAWVNGHMLEVELSQYAAGTLSRQEFERRLGAMVAAAPAARATLSGVLRQAVATGQLSAADCAALIAALPLAAGADRPADKTRARPVKTPTLEAEPATRLPTGMASPAVTTTTAATVTGLPEVGDSAPAVGRTLSGKYRLERELGAGGMGVVFLAADLLGTESVAIKVLRTELQAIGDVMRVLRDEMIQTRRLRHENIVGVYALEQDGAQRYIVMEYLIGKTLREVLDQDYVRGIPLARAWPIIEGVGAGLAFAHDRGVIHSDLKPDNIFLTAAGIPKILDFGIARAMRAPAAGNAPSLHSYTPSYASCELIDGAPPDFSDDVYSLACVIYELVSGRRPFDGLEATVACEQKRVPAPLAALSAAQNAHLRRGLAFRRVDRIASVEELLKGMKSPPTRRAKPIIAGGMIAALVGIIAWWRFSGGGDHLPPAAVRHEAPAAPASGVARRAGDVFKDCAAGCPAMVVVPAGTFRMGSPADEPGRRADEEMRRITFAHAFALSVYPVTKADFRTFLADSHYQRTATCDNLANPQLPRAVSFEEPGYVQSESDPAVCVGLQDARAYAAWINHRVDAEVYRLPSEAEWEYAARAGVETGTPWPADDSQACRFGNFGDRSFAMQAGVAVADSGLCDDTFAATSPVGSFPQNAWGLFDIMGNVFTWTESCNQQLDATNGDAFVTNCQKYRVVRGAAFSTLLGGHYVRFARRVIPPPAMQAANTWGFRLARTL